MSSITLAEALGGSATELSETAFHFAAHGPRAAATTAADQAYPNVIVLSAPDLAAAQRQRRQILSESTDRTPLVLLRIEAIVAETFDQARLKSAECGRPAVSGPSAIRYVGTARGLAGLIADVSAADVADGVVIVSLPLAEPPTAIVQQTIPWLQRHKLIGSVSNLNDR